MGGNKLPVIAVTGNKGWRLGTFLSRRFTDSSMIWGRRSMKTFFIDRARPSEDKERDMKIFGQLSRGHASDEITAREIRAVIEDRTSDDKNELHPALKFLHNAIRSGYTPGGIVLDFLEHCERRER